MLNRLSSRGVRITVFVTVSLLFVAAYGCDNDGNALYKGKPLSEWLAPTRDIDLPTQLRGYQRLAEHESEVPRFKEALDDLRNHSSPVARLIYWRRPSILYAHHSEDQKFAPELAKNDLLAAIRSEDIAVVRLEAQRTARAIGSSEAMQISELQNAISTFVKEKTLNGVLPERVGQSHRATLESLVEELQSGIDYPMFLETYKGSSNTDAE